MKHQKFALLAGAVTLILLVSACSQAVFQADSPAYPTFSLVGAPDRDVTYELRVTGPGMEPISRTGIGPTSGSLTLPVPAGRNRTFELLAENDVYSGFVTTSLAGGRENRVPVPMLPGPVFVDARGNRLIQIRDFGSTVETDAEDEIIPGTVRAFFPSEITPDNQTDVLFSSIGQLIVPWIGDFIDLLVFSKLSLGTEPTIVGDNISSGLASAIAAHPTRNSVVIGAAGFDNPLDLTLTEIDVSSGTVTETITVETVSEWFQVEDLGGEPFIGFEGIAVDRNDVAWVVLFEGNDGNELVLVGISLVSGNVVATQSIQSGVSFRNYNRVAAGLQPPRVDIRTIRDAVVIVLSGTTSEHPPIYRYDSINGLVSWGTGTDAADPTPGEFWGPRQFVATRRDNELIIIDQKDDDRSDFSPDPNLDGIGRLVRFQFGTTDGWQTFGEGEFEFFDTGFSG